MEKPLRILLFALVALGLISLAMSLFGNSNLRDIRQNLEKAKRSADSALLELQFSKSKLDSIRADMVVFKSYINQIQKRVELNDAEKRIREEKDQKKAAELRQDIVRLRSEIETDSLPDIEEATTKR